MQGINVSPELQSLLGGIECGTQFHLDSASLPTYWGECFEGDSHEAWKADGYPQLLLNVGHTEHGGHTIVFFENITHGSGLHVMAIFDRRPSDVTTDTSPVTCFRVQARGVPCEVALPDDGDHASLIMVPAHVGGCIKPVWYEIKE